MAQPNLKKIRQMQNKTAVELAAALGVDRITVFRWESGSIKLTLDRARQVAAVLGCPIDALVDTNAFNRWAAGR